MDYCCCFALNWFDFQNGAYRSTFVECYGLLARNSLLNRLTDKVTVFGDMEARDGRLVLVADCVYNPKRAKNVACNS